MDAHRTDIEHTSFIIEHNECIQTQEKVIGQTQCSRYRDKMAHPDEMARS